MTPIKVFVKLIVTDYIVSWAIAPELLLLFAFLVVAEYTGPIGIPTALSMVAFFSLIITPVSVRRLTNRAWSNKSRYLIAANLGRRGYILGLTIAAFVISTSLAAISFFAVWAMNVATFDFTGAAKNFALLGAIIAFIVALGMVLSRLTAPRFGSPVSIAIIIFFGFADERSVKSVPAKTIIRLLQTYGPHLKNALSAVSEKSAAGWQSTVLQLVVFTVVLLASALILFDSKELLFED